MFYLQIAGFFSLISYLILLTIKASAAFSHFNRNRDQFNPTEIPPEKTDATPTEKIATIVQPILSGDPDLENALRENSSELPDWAQLFWMIDQDDQTALDLATQIRAQTKSEIQIIECPKAPPDTNPKTAKLQIALENCQTKYFFVLDDDTRITSRNLRAAIWALSCADQSARCDLYTGLPSYHGFANFWTSLLSHFVNNNSIMTYISTLSLSQPISINGMFYGFKTESSLKLGGFRRVHQFLCDDYEVAKLFRENGMKIRQGTTSQNLKTTINQSSDYFRIMHRWHVFANVLIADQSLGKKLLLFILLGLPPLLFIVGTACSILSIYGLVAVFVTFLIRHFVLRKLQKIYFEPVPRFSILVSLISEFLQPLHWILARLNPNIVWRGQRIRVDSQARFRLS